MWDATGRTRGLLWGGYPLCRQARGCELCAADDTLCRSPGTFTGRPLCSVRKTKDLGMETREIPGIRPRCARWLHRSGSCSGSHERAHRAVCDSFHVHPGSQPGACSPTGGCSIVRHTHGFPIAWPHRFHPVAHNAPPILLRAPRTSVHITRWSIKHNQPVSSSCVCRSVTAMFAPRC